MLSLALLLTISYLLNTHEVGVFDFLGGEYVDVGLRGCNAVWTLK
jgi:hypothetical protein